MSMTRSDFLAFALGTMQELQDDDPSRFSWLHDLQVDVLQEEKHLFHAVWVSDRVEAHSDLSPLFSFPSAGAAHGFALYAAVPSLGDERLWQRIGGSGLKPEHRAWAHLRECTQEAFQKHGTTRFRLRIFHEKKTYTRHFRLLGVRHCHIDQAKAGVTEDRYRVMGHDNRTIRVALTAHLWHWKDALGVVEGDAVDSTTPSWSKMTEMLAKLEHHKVVPNYPMIQTRQDLWRRSRGDGARPALWGTWECDAHYEEAADRLMLLAETLRKKKP